MFLKSEKERRSKLNSETITFRLTLKYSLFIFITLVVVSATTLFSVRAYVYNQSESQLRNIGDTIESKLKLNEKITNADLQEISNMTENIDVNIRKNEAIIFKTSETNNSNFPIDLTGRISSVEIEENHFLFYNSVYKNEQGDMFIVQVIKDMYNEMGFIKILFQILLIINAIAFGFSIVLGYFMSIRALSPINKIVAQAQKITISDLSQRIEIIGPDDELKRLSETFNDLISRIEIGYEKQNRFALDASHELATPLAVIKGYLDIISRWGKNDPKVLDEAILNMQKEVKNVTDLLDTLLFIAKGDNDITRIDKNKFWLNALIVEVYKEAQLIYPKYNFEININHSILVNLDIKLIKQMIRAVIDNSVKYSPQGSKITISCIKKSETAQIVITDCGIGIDPNEIKYIFDRFYRVDKARSREISGTGLGLSIVKWIINVHNGSIEVKSKRGQGTSITLNLPIG